MNRFRETEVLAATVRNEIPRAAVRWLAAVRTPLEGLTTAALDAGISDEAFLVLVESFSASLPALLETMDHAALGELMETSMGAAMGNGIGQRVSHDSSHSHSSHSEEMGRNRKHRKHRKTPR